MPRSQAHRKFFGFEMRREMARGQASSTPDPTPEPTRIPDDLPVIPIGNPRAIRVLRCEHPEGRPNDWKWVLIWETSSETEAIQVARAQKYRAAISIWGGKRDSCFDNGKPKKVTGVVRHLIDSIGILCGTAELNGNYDVEVGDLAALVPSWRAELCPQCLALVPHAE
jgi:hypothetical protein